MRNVSVGHGEFEQFEKSRAASSKARCCPRLRSSFLAWMGAKLGQVCAGVLASEAVGVHMSSASLGSVCMSSA